MSIPNWPRRLLCLSLSVPFGPALACGPDFPMQLLGDRAQALAELPEGNFAFEVNRLGQQIAGLKPTTDITLTPYWDSDDNARPYREQRSQAEASELPAALQEKVAQLRNLQDPRQVEEQGADLPDELRLYLAGAVAFDNGEHAVAADYFAQVLALPAEQRKLRSTWAAYSQGRALAALSQQSSDAAPALQAQARQAFQLARTLSADGFSDPLELGVASLGEEARLAKLAGDWNSAVQLYASQSRLGSGNGYSSLRQLADELVAMPDEQLQRQLQQPLPRKLLTAYLLSHIGWDYDSQQPAQEQRLPALLRASLGEQLDDADRLAALSYQQGDFATAQGYLKQAGDTGLAWWLRAKLALRDGDKAQAAAAYAKAAAAFPREESWGSRQTPDWDYESLKPGCRVEGEGAILALERGDYLQAFDLLYRSQDIYWQDAANVAERVLTLDELKGYVDAQVPAAPVAQAEEGGYVPRPVATQLRELLGRRLLREGRYDEAPAYFATPQLQADAKAYGQNRQDALSRWTATGRAEALYAAASLARTSGMEILGYEMAPDYAWLGGSYSLGNAELQPGPFIGAGEVQRQLASVAKPDQRYHYRYVAADLANQAADQLPHSSQAFAAVLCTAAGWVAGSDQEIALYKRYVQQGPFVMWAEDFGKQCEQPRFDQANLRYLTESLDKVRATLRPYKAQVLPAGLAILAGLAWLWLRRRKSKA
ncbi:hypothetical protein [Pseudomonas xantholysinigenes]|uniref:Tetratricopeptide repeat protein n=1 Tax=Pseudomonas xantholysinigenes TaxID=2745490 RepID=A0A9E6Q0Z9_9PSED|nr:hypothetical protein [Pseudomonas xantholysinigenes]QXI40843.1 hypothetical protein HU772_012500 [Pseudomonas xantholysinigenes]